MRSAFQKRGRAVGPLKRAKCAVAQWPISRASFASASGMMSRPDRTSTHSHFDAASTTSSLTSRTESEKHSPPRAIASFPRPPRAIRNHSAATFSHPNLSGEQPGSAAGSGKEEHHAALSFRNAPPGDGRDSQRKQRGSDGEPTQRQARLNVPFGFDAKRRSASWRFHPSLTKRLTCRFENSGHSDSRTRV